MGFLGDRFKAEGGKITPHPCLKLVRIMLEIANLTHKYTHICSFRKYIFYYQGLLNFADVSIFFGKNKRLLAKIVSLLKAIVWELC